MTDRTPDMDNDLRSRIVSMEHTVSSNGQRVTALEQWRGQKDIADAVMATQFTGIKEDLASIKGIVSRLAWLMVTGIALGFIAFIINGGLKVP